MAYDFEVRSIAGTESERTVHGDHHGHATGVRRRPRGSGEPDHDAQGRHAGDPDRGQLGHGDRRQRLPDLLHQRRQPRGLRRRALEHRQALRRSDRDHPADPACSFVAFDATATREPARTRCTPRAPPDRPARRPGRPEGHRRAGPGHAELGRRAPPPPATRSPSTRPTAPRSSPRSRRRTPARRRSSPGCRRRPTSSRSRRRTPAGNVSAESATRSRANVDRGDGHGHDPAGDWKAERAPGRSAATRSPAARSASTPSIQARAATGPPTPVKPAMLDQSR